MKKLAILAAALTLVACGNKNDNNKTATTQSNDGKTKEFSIFAIHLGQALNTDLPVYKKAEEATNVKLRGVASRNQTDQVQAYNLLLSSGNLPDIISYELTESLDKLGNEGGVISLEKLIDEHAPHIKKFWEQHPRYKKDAVAANGHIYFIPNYYDYYNWKASQGYFIRKDWLNKLGLEEPTTIPELYEVLKAFKTQDPNGNGKVDEIPFFVRADTVKKVFLALIDLFQVEPGWYEIDGKVVYGPATDDFKIAMTELAKWYKEGLIDQEVFTRGMGARDFMLSNNLGGLTNDWFASTASYNNTLKESIPGFDFSALLPPEYKGKRVTKNSRPTYIGGWSISANAKDPVEIVKYFDYWYTPEGRNLWNFGVEGKEWVMKDGNPAFTDYVLKNPERKNPLAVIRESGAQFRLGMAQDVEYERQWATPEALEAVNLYSNNNAIAEPFPILKYTEEESRELLRIDAQLTNYFEEMGQKWIMGSADVNKDWENYVKRVEEIGLKKAQEIQQNAYNRFMNN